MALAGLSEAMVDANTRVYCRGSLFLYNRVFHCSVHQGHGSVDLETALSKSCNVFFYELGRKMGISKIAAQAQALGLGERSGIDLPGERSGLMPTPEWKQQVRRFQMVRRRDHLGLDRSRCRDDDPPAAPPGGQRHSLGRLFTTPHVFLRADRSTPEMNVELDDPPA